MKTIPLTQGKVSIVDDEDYEFLNAHKWFALRDKKNDCWYARRNIPKESGGQTQISMHRAICGFPKREVDHKNGNGLDNRRLNLRECEHRQNSRNRRLHRDNTSGFKGVSWYKNYGKWLAKIRVNYKQINLGYYERIEDAVEAYQKAAKKHFGEFART